MIPDRYHGATMVKHSSTLTMLMPAVLAMAPPLGGLLQEYFSWRAPFYFVFIYIGLVLVISYKLMPETNAKRHESNNVKLINNYISLIKNINFIGFAIISASLFTGLMAYLTVSPYLFEVSLGLSPSQYGLISIAVGVIIIIGSLINIRVTKKVSPKQMLYVGTSIKLTAGFILLALVLLNKITIVSLLFVCLLYFAALPLTFPNSFASAFSVIKGNFGAAGALIAFIQVLSGAIASGILSILPEKTAMPLAIFYIASGVISLSVLLLLKSKNKN